MNSQQMNVSDILTENTFKIAEAELSQRQNAYMKDKTSENLQAVLLAQKQLDDLKIRHMKKVPQSDAVPEILKKLEDVAKWMKEHGRKAGLRTLQKDTRKGLLIKNEKYGGYLVSDVERYAQTKKIISKPADVDTAIEIRDRKEQADVRYKEAMAKREEYKLEVLQGKYLPKDEIWLELAARGIAFQDQLKNTYEANAMELMEIANGGDSEPFVARLCQTVTEALAEFAKPMVLVVDLSGFEAEAEDDPQ